MNPELLSILETGLKQPITATIPVNGGDISQAFILYSNENKFFLKLNDSDKADLFEKEYKGLELLISTGSIKVPEPIVTGKHGRHIYLLMEYVEKGNTLAIHWQELGRKLAALHKNSADHFGLDYTNYLGSLRQENTPSASWSEFYATQRILYLAKMAFDEKKCDVTDIKMAEKLCAKLQSLFPEERPSLLHGDLRSGNFMFNIEGCPVIFDPAVYYGHREMDIGMSLLFGGFDKSFYSFYNEAWPLEKNWQQRTDLAQLYPLMVHLVLFGGAYYQQVRSVLKKYTQ